MEQRGEGGVTNDDECPGPYKNLQRCSLCIRNTLLIQLLSGTVHAEVAYARDAACVRGPPQGIDPVPHMQDFRPILLVQPKINTC